MRSFRAVFVAVVIGCALVIAAFLINSRRPVVETARPTAALVRATGKCASCHTRLQHSIVREYEMSQHAQKGVNCLDCHQPAEQQRGREHHGFVIAQHVTSGNCRSCHGEQYAQFVRSRHAAVSWAAVYGKQGLTAQQVAFAEQYQPGGANRPPHPLVALEGASAAQSGCAQCHAIGKPNDDGSIGSCTACHTRHTSSVELARLPATCGQCHMGPDHSQIEIYTESKHGLMFNAQRSLLNLSASPKSLTTRDMFVPTCATCHMSGINGMTVTHDPSDRLSYYLAAEITNKRPNFDRAQATMKQVCQQCHTATLVNGVYTQTERVVESTNARVRHARAIVDGLRHDGVLSGPAFSTPIDFAYFDLWHYDGRTSKHGAFMGGADFVQWHGNYPMLQRTVELEAAAKEMRREARATR
jgi:hypothetical protein